MDKKLTISDLFIRQGWKKFKKPRQARKNSHLHEWKSDVMNYLESLSQDTDPFLQTTKKAIREELSIPERSLDKVLKVLKKEQKIFLKVKSGRGGGIRIASIKSVLLSVIQIKRERQEAYFANIATFFEERLGFIQQVLQRAEMAFKQVQEVSLFEVDVG